MTISLGVTVGRLKIETPAIIASGIAGYGDEWDELVNFNAVGAVVLKGVALEPWSGNPPPRIVEAPNGIINAIGLENVGVDRFVSDKLPSLKNLKPKIVANVVGRYAGEYRDVCAVLGRKRRLAALELNVSCPNVKRGGMAFCADVVGLRELVRDCRDVTDKPLWVKLAPMVTDIVAVARAALDGGADALTIANTVPAMAVDVGARRAVLGNVYGGLSGPAIRPINLRLVNMVYEATGADIIASGGVDGWEAAAAYILAGARAVQVGTALFDNPAAPDEIVAGLREYVARAGYSRFSSLIGNLEEDST